MTRMMRRVLLAALVLQGCAPSLPELNVAQQWNDAISRLDLYAVYPMQEDLQLGDVLLIGGTSGAANDQPGFNAVRLGSIDGAALERALCAEQRPRFAAQPIKPGDTPAAEAPLPRSCLPSANAAAALPTEAERSSRLRDLSIPKLTVARVSQGALNGAGFLSNVGAQIGIGSSGAVAVSIELTSIQEMALPGASAYALLRETTPGFLARLTMPGLFFHLKQIANDLPARLCNSASEEAARAALNTMGVGIVVPTRIVYARTVVFEFARDSVTAFDAVANLAALLPAPAGVTLPSGNTVIDARPGTNTVPQSPAPSGATVATNDAGARIDSLLNALATRRPTTPGVSVSFGVGQTGGLALSQTYARPMAAGAGAMFRFSVMDAVEGLFAANARAANDQQLSGVCRSYDPSLRGHEVPLVTALLADSGGRATRAQSTAGMVSTVRAPERVQALRFR